MAAVPKSSALRREDFPSESAWIDRLLRPLVAFMAAVSKALGELELETNVVAQIETVLLFTGDDVINSFPHIFSVKMSRRPQVMILGSIEDLDDSNAIFPSSGMPSWGLTGDGKVKLTYVPGLSSNRRYRCTLLLF